VRQDDSDIRCMLIPLRSGRLLLPNAAVAEVIGYRQPDAMNSNADWLQGKVSYHQRDIPVVDFEYLIGKVEGAASIRQRIAVCYAPDPEATWPLIGVVAQGIPRLLHLGCDAIEAASEGRAGDGPVRITLSVAGDKLLLPDLDYLQAQLPAS